MSRRFSFFMYAITTLVLLGCATSARPPHYSAHIERTAGGIPHITAPDWGSLGFATGYVMAEDNVCILARQYIKFGARLSEFEPNDPAALSSDFFYQLLIDRGTAEQTLSPRLEQLFDGAAAGYNHYLTETGIDQLPDPLCRGAAWVQATTGAAVKRVSGVDYALDYMQPMIVAATPPRENAAAAKAMQAEQIAMAVDLYMEVPKQGGSNAIAIGAEGAQEAHSLLLTNPHMPWNQPFQRFYPMHQTIPGELDMLGANLIGRPRVGFGTTESLAWTSTVSTAKRQSFYRLQLLPGKPTWYLFDGAAREMKQETVTVGGQSHTFYSTHFGALLVQSPFFKWTTVHAFAVKMPEVGFRGEESAFEQYAAKSVRELKQVHNKYQFLTVNLIAADASGEVMYTDPGPVPNLSNDQMQDCAVLRGAALDGTRSACQWQSDDRAVATGLIPPQELPLIYRRDYVTNSNDSYWLANPAQPLEGYANILGSERSARTLRTRSGLRMLQQYLAGAAGDRIAGINQDELLELTLANESFAGQILRDDIVAMCRHQPSVTIDNREVDLAEACAVLAAWDLHANIDSRGAHLFRQMLAQANDNQFSRKLPASFTPARAFDPAAPLSTPSGLSETAADAALQALGKAVLQLQAANLALAAPLGEVQTVTRNGRRIPIHGGPEIEGIFNKIEADFQGEAGYPEVTKWSSSWIMVTEFTDQGPRARGILTYSLSANPESPWYSDQTEMFSNKQWLDLPFNPVDIRAASIRSYDLSSE
ncbi:MAG: penicillin acylase family protein [Gammaproteobacteria bacterium]|nr:penicillin acylase family protein [Gammaproteobacteria bacterium]